MSRVVFICTPPVCASCVGRLPCAGVGVFSFPIADELKGTGKMFAMEISTSLVRYLRSKADMEGYWFVRAYDFHFNQNFLEFAGR